MHPNACFYALTASLSAEPQNGLVSAGLHRCELLAPGRSQFGPDKRANVIGRSRVKLRVELVGGWVSDKLKPQHVPAVPPWQPGTKCEPRRPQRIDRVLQFKSVHCKIDMNQAGTAVGHGRSQNVSEVFPYVRKRQAIDIPVHIDGPTNFCLAGQFGSDAGESSSKLKLICKTGNEIVIAIGQEYLTRRSYRQRFINDGHRKPICPGSTNREVARVRREVSQHNAGLAAT